MSVEFTMADIAHDGSSIVATTYNGAPISSIGLITGYDRYGRKLGKHVLINNPETWTPF